MAVQSPARFSLRIPKTWFEFDIWRATRTGDLARMVDERLKALPELRPQRAVILRGLRQLAEDAERRGALYCAGAADRVEDGLLLASLMVFGTSGLPDPALNTVEAIAAQLTAATPEAAPPATDHDEHVHDERAHEVNRAAAAAADPVAWREVRIIELGAGRAVRVRGVSSITSSASSGALPVVTMQTLLPVPGDDDVVNIVLTSPHVDFADGLLDLFDAITSTFTWQAGPSPG